MTKNLISKTHNDNNFTGVKVSLKLVAVMAISIFVVLVIVFSLMLFFSSDKIMNNANPDYFKEGVVTNIAADSIKIMSDDGEHIFKFSSTNLASKNGFVKLVSGEKHSFGSVSDIGRGDKIKVEGWEMKNEVALSSIYIYK